jgi:hypothetical protein
MQFPKTCRKTHFRALRFIYQSLSCCHWRTRRACYSTMTRLWHFAAASVFWVALTSAATAAASFTWPNEFCLAVLMPLTGGSTYCPQSRAQLHGRFSAFLFVLKVCTCLFPATGPDSLDGFRCKHSFTKPKRAPCSIVANLVTLSAIVRCALRASLRFLCLCLSCSSGGSVCCCAPLHTTWFLTQFPGCLFWQR